MMINTVHVLPGALKNEWITLFIKRKLVRTPASSSFFWYAREKSIRQLPTEEVSIEINEP